MIGTQTQEGVRIFDVLLDVDGLIIIMSYLHTIYDRTTYGNHTTVLIFGYGLIVESVYGMPPKKKNYVDRETVPEEGRGVAPFPYKNHS